LNPEEYTSNTNTTQTGKRKRDASDETTSGSNSVTLQIITGSYERVLHGLQATVALPLDPTNPTVAFDDTFLFHAHGSCIRSLAISPPSDATTTSTTSQPTKRILATGSTDERINLYQISSTAPIHDPITSLQPKPLPFVKTIPSTSSTSNGSTNRELGSLLHHSSTVTALHFPSRTKLLSASSDNTIAVARTRDWTVLTTMKAPVPKALNRPSGDTSAPGDVPAGINALAVHPSSKLGVSVGQGEKSMRLWDLVRGKKAGVLVFERRVLEAVGEARFRGGEGRSVVWGRGGEEFAVGFERGVVVFGLDCAVRGVVKVDGTKVCQIRYLPGAEDVAEGEESNEKDGVQEMAVLAISTEDGRVLFYDTNPINAAAMTTPEATTKKGKSSEPPPQQLCPLAQVGTPKRGSRIKDIDIFKLPTPSPSSSSSATEDQYILAAGTSDGSIRLWALKQSDFQLQRETATDEPEAGDGPQAKVGLKLRNDKENNTTPTVVPSATKQIGILLGTYETGRRITCLAGFVMEDPNVVRQGNAAKKGKVETEDGDGEGVGNDDDEEEEEDGNDEDEDDEFGGFD